MLWDAGEAGTVKPGSMITSRTEEEASSFAIVIRAHRRPVSGWLAILLATARIIFPWGSAAADLQNTVLRTVLGGRPGAGVRCSETSGLSAFKSFWMSS